MGASAFSWSCGALLALLCLSECNAIRRSALDSPIHRATAEELKVIADVPKDSDWVIPDPALQILWFFGAPETVANIGEGEKVEWLWFDDKPHSVAGEGNSTSLFKGNGGGDKTVALNGFKYTVTFDTPGTYSFHDKLNPEVMQGVIKVKPKFNLGGVTIPWYDGISYGAASAVIETGDTVTWEWMDELGHSLVAANGDKSIFTGPGANGTAIMVAGFKYNKTFTEPGIYLYNCAQHGESMRGNITVFPKGYFSPPPPSR